MIMERGGGNRSQGYQHFGGNTKQGIEFKTHNMHRQILRLQVSANVKRTEVGVVRKNKGCKAPQGATNSVTN